MGPCATASNPFSTADDLLILAVVVDHSMLSEDLVAYILSGSLYLPLEELSRLLGFAITSVPGEGRAYGFFLDEKRTFDLDLARESVRVEGLELSIDPNFIHVAQDDLYVDVRLLSEWFPITLTVNRFSLLLTVVPHEPLPFQRRLERERRAARLQGHPKNSPSSDISGEAREQPLFSRPFTAHRLSGDLRFEPGSAPTVTHRNTTHLVSTIFNLDATASLTIQDDRVNISRLRLSRQSPSPTLLGPLQARSFTFGVVTFPHMPFPSDNKRSRCRHKLPPPALLLGVRHAHLHRRD